jgi:hypothetical protein
MRNSFKKVQYLLLALSIFALTGCGATSTTTAANPTGNTTKLTAKVVGLQSDNIATVRLQVTGATIPTARQDFAGKTGGTIEVYPGSALIVTAQAFDATNVMLSEGAVTDVTVVAGTPTTVTVTMNPPVVKTADVTCLGCHETTRDVTGQNLVADYKQSGHYTNTALMASSNGSTQPGCAGCHGTSHNDLNPAASGRCADCHTSINSAHSNSLTGPDARPAMYLATNYQNGCSACHEPHNPINGIGKDERQAWAQSAHGDVNGVAWSAEDFTTACQRCHTATGFKMYVASNYATQTASIVAAGDPTREVLACDACHNNDSFSVRPAPAFTTPYTANGPINQSNKIPDVGESNLCVSCHTGRATQADIEAVADFTNASFKNSHYLPAAGIMYMKVGFINFTSMKAFVPGSTTATYGLNYSLPTLLGTNGKTAKGGVDAAYGGVLGGVGSAHRALGTPTSRGGEAWMVPATAGLWESNGPCVTCHIKADLTNMPNPAPNYDTAAFGAIPTIRTGGGHSLSATSPDAARQLCVPCHNDAGGLENPVTAAEEKLAEAKPYYDAGLAVIAKLFATAQYNIKFDNAAYPYFFDLTKDPSGNTAVTDWTRGTGNQLFGKKVMGAAYNLKLLSTDSAAYVHGRTYSQRLIYDTIDFLDDGIMNLTAAGTLVAKNPTLFPATSLTDTAGTWLYKAKGIRK